MPTRFVFYLFAALVVLCQTAWAEAPTLVVQAGHTGSITSAVADPHGEFVATAGNDGTVKLWNLARERVVLTLIDPAVAGSDKEYTPVVDAVAVSPDGRLVVTGSRDGFVRVYDVATGTLRGKWEAAPTGRLALAFHPSGGQLASAHESGADIVLWGLDGTRKKTLTAPSRAQFAPKIQSLAFSPDGSRLAAGGGAYGAYGTYLLDAGSGQVLAFLEDDDEVETVAFSPDGKHIATAANQARVWETATGKTVTTFEPKLIDPRLAWTGQGQVVVSSQRAENPFLWVGVPAGGKVTSLQSDGYPATCVAVTPDGRLVAGHTDGNGSLWAASGTRLAELLGRSETVTALSVNADGKLMVTGGRSGSVRVWDLAAGRIVRKLEGLEALITDTDLNKSLAVACEHYYGKACGWDAESGNLLWTYQADTTRRGEGFNRVVISPDASLVALGAGNGDIHVLEASSGRRKLSLSGEKGAQGGIAFSPDGTLLAVGTLDGEVLIWELRTRSIVSRRKAADGRSGISGRRIWGVAFSPDGTTLAAGTGSGAISLFELGYDEPPVQLKGHRTSVWDLAFSPDGTQLLSSSGDQTARLWDVKNRKALAVLTGHLDGLSDGTFASAGKVVVTSSYDNTIRFWNPQGRQLATAIEIDGGQNWVVTTPDGLFDGTSEGQRLIDWRIGDKLFALEQFFENYYRPGLLGKVAPPGSAPQGRATEPPPAPISQVAAPPSVSISSPEAGARLGEPTATVRLRVKDQGGGVSQVRLFHNGHRLADSHVKAEAAGVYTVEVPMVPGRNEFRATAFNGDGSVESRGDRVRVLCTADDTRKPTLHLVTVGIDSYQNGLKLGFAVKDAEAIRDFFKPGLFPAVNRTALLDAQAGRSQILAELKKVASQAAAQDTMVLYLAGHGTLLGDVYYFLPYDAVVDTDEDIRRTAVSSVELAEALAEIPATRQLVVLDSCHSGAATSAMGRFLASRDAVGMIRAQQRLARSSGTFLVAASTAEQYAKEFPELGHGVLTYAILKGLADREAPRDHEGYITVNGLLGYLSQQVPALTERYHGDPQHVVQYSTGQDFPLVVGGGS